MCAMSVEGQFRHCSLVGFGVLLPSRAASKGKGASSRQAKGFSADWVTSSRLSGGRAVDIVMLGLYGAAEDQETSSDIEMRTGLRAWESESERLGPTSSAQCRRKLS